MTETKRPISVGAEEILNLYFPVLDGNSFISIIDYMGTDESIEQAARVSYGAGTRKTTRTRGLIRYLQRHSHSTPREMIELKFHVCCPVFVMRQWIRTRTASVNEYSGRYSLMPMLFYTPPPEQFNFQSKSNNQGRGNIASNDMYKAATERWDINRNESAKLYEDLTAGEVARELARIDLPLSTLTQFYWKIDLHNLFRFLTLRVDSHAQWEIQEFGKIMAGVVQRLAPLSFEAWMDYEFLSSNLSRMELNILRKLISTGQNQQGKKHISTQSHTIITEDNMPELSSRETAELLSKFQPKEVPNFELDLTKAKSASYFENIMMKAVPNIDKLK